MAWISEGERVMVSPGRFPCWPFTSTTSKCTLHFVCNLSCVHWKISNYFKAGFKNAWKLNPLASSNLLHHFQKMCKKEKEKAICFSLRTNAESVLGITSSWWRDLLFMVFYVCLSVCLHRCCIDLKHGTLTLWNVQPLGDDVPSHL